MILGHEPGGREKRFTTESMKGEFVEKAGLAGLRRGVGTLSLIGPDGRLRSGAD